VFSLLKGKIMNDDDDDLGGPTYIRMGLEEEPWEWTVFDPEAEGKNEIYKDTLELCNDLIDMEPENPDYHVSRAQALWDLGRGMEASWSLMKAKRIGHPEAAQLLALLKQKLR
jgi:hypothetical protein